MIKGKKRKSTQIWSCGRESTTMSGPSPSLALKSSCKTLWPVWKEASGKMDAGSNKCSRFRHEVRDDFHTVVKKKIKVRMPEKLSPKGQSAQRVHRASEGRRGEEGTTDETEPRAGVPHISAGMKKAWHQNSVKNQIWWLSNVNSGKHGPHAAQFPPAEGSPEQTQQCLITSPVLIRLFAWPGGLLKSPQILWSCRLDPSDCLVDAMLHVFYMLV